MIELHPDINKSQIKEEARYICVDQSAATNHNKFWNAFLMQDNSVITWYGRVGEPGKTTSKPFGSAYQAENFYKSKIREKESGKGGSNSTYVKQRTITAGVTSGEKCAVSTHNLAELAKNQIDTNSPETLALIQILAAKNKHNILSNLDTRQVSYNDATGLFTTPVGIITADAIVEARDLLVKMGDYVVKSDYDNPLFYKTISQYLTFVPQDIGRNRLNTKVFFPDLAAVQKQATILDSLEGSLNTILTAPPKTDDTPVVVPPKLFEAKLHIVEDGAIIDALTREYKKTLQAQHAAAKLKLKRVFSVEIGHMHKAYTELCAETRKRGMGEVELWHGTKVGNLLSLLKSGFLLSPPATVTIAGKMFGNGIYFSDQSTKSLNYAYGYWDGKYENTCYMFRCNVAMGEAYTPRGYSECSGWTKAKTGYDSTYAKAHVSGVQNNEMIVYSTHQIDPVYLIEFSDK